MGTESRAGVWEPGTHTERKKGGISCNFFKSEQINPRSVTTVAFSVHARSDAYIMKNKLNSKNHS